MKKILTGLAVLAMLVPMPAVQANRHDSQVLLNRANAARIEHGLAPLESGARLHRLARRWSLKMVETHNLKDPRVQFCVVWGANVGVGTSSLRIHKAFMHSPEHKYNILYPYFHRAGVAVARKHGQLWATEVFCR